MTGDRWIAVGAVSACLAVICGAFAAHGLEKLLPKQYAGQTLEQAGEMVPAARKYLGNFKTAAEYQMYHALGMIAVGLLAHGTSTNWLNLAGWSFLVGTVLFSGSLYALVLSGITKLGMITPIGGVLFIVGWVSLAIGAIRGGAPGGIVQ